MDFDLPPDDDPRRLDVRAWLAANPDPTGRELHTAGYVVPHWPAPYGIDADPMQQVLIDDELRRAGVRRPENPIGIGWAAPTIAMAGSVEMKARYLDPIFTGEEFWCQMFSEPDAGSDLANLATRAVRDGDEYVVNGSKIWTSGGHMADFGILIARTDPDVAKHKGISYFVCPMDLPGITMSPIVDMTSAHSFNQVFFDDVRIPASLLVGEEGDGWRLTRVTLANERVSLSSAGSLWGAGTSAEDLLELVRLAGGTSDPVVRQRLSSLHCEAEVLRLNRLRTLSAQLAGREPGSEANIQKAMADDHGQHVMELAKDLAGTSGMLVGSGPAGSLDASRAEGTTENRLITGEFPDVSSIWHYGYVFSPALTLGGGTFAVQRNIIAERVLGLPREPDAQRGLSWSEARASESHAGRSS
jgi:alkylation response protein AidB-like acyl-CoA dehydrogenase